MPNKTMHTNPTAAIAATPPKTPEKTAANIVGSALFLLLRVFAINNIVYYLMSHSHSYDVAIIGGGIAGLYCALKLSPTLKVILFESNDYFGGRIKTNVNPHFEIGAGRFNEDHVLFCKLLREFNLTFIPLSSNTDYIDKIDGPIPYATKYLKHLLKQVTINNSEKMRDITFYQHCVNTLGKEKADYIVNIHGYIGDIKDINAYDGINMHKKKVGQYFVVKEGFGELCKRMVNKMNIPKINKLLNHNVSSVKREGDLFRVDHVLAKKVIFAVPPKHLTFPILKPLYPLFESVESIPLLRIYANYPEKWLQTTTVTDDVSRRIIPIHDGLIMIAYADGEHVKPFMKNGKLGKLKNNSELKKIISEELDNLFPNIKIPQPNYFKAFLWDIGYHSWKAKYNSHKVINTLFSIDGIYICGEAFSLNQGWVEGALTSADNIVKSIL